MVEPQMTPTPLPNLRRSQGKPHSTKSNKLFIPSVGSPVTGITITVTGRRVGGGKLILEVLSTRHPFSTTIPIGRKVVPYTTSNASYTLGGTSELWGRKWDPSDFANGKFQINCYGSVVVTSDKVTVDAISVIVSHGDLRTLEPART